MKDQKITALTIKLAEIQSQVLRLNALGDRLADDANIPENEFNFSHLPLSGGPSSCALPLNNKTLDQLFVENRAF